MEKPTRGQLTMSLKPFSGALDELLLRTEEIRCTPPELRQCEAHGEYTASPVALGPRAQLGWTGCPACLDLARKAADEERRGREAIERQAELERSFRRSGIPERFIGKSFANYLTDTPAKSRALKAAKRFAESEDGGLSMILCGKPGTGKTHLACAIAAAKIASRKTAAFMTAVGAVRYVRSTYRRDAEMTESEAIASLCSVDLLVLDEVGVQHGSEHEKMILFDVINDRYANCRGTILLSNLSAEDLQGYLGDRIMDRFREGGVVIAFDWESHRGRRAA